MSAAVAASSAAARAAGLWRGGVALWVANSEFVRAQLVAGGYPAERIAVKPNFVHPDPGPGTHEGDFALFAGRLSAEKGVATLLGAFEALGGRIRLKVAGDGPLAGAVREAAGRIPGIEWLGSLGAAVVRDLMGEARVLLAPSESYETFGRVAIEAFARGTPVIASDIGGLAELVTPERTGLLVRPGDLDDLAKAVDWLWAHPAEAAAMGRAAREEFERRYTAAAGERMLLEVYDRAREAAR